MTILIFATNGWQRFMFLRILINLHKQKLVESQNEYEHSKFDKDFMLFYYKKLNKITICKQIKENF